MPYPNDTPGENLSEDYNVSKNEGTLKKAAGVGWPSFIFFLIVFLALDSSLDVYTLGLSSILTIWINIANFFVFSWLSGWNRRIGWWTVVFVFESVPFVSILPLRLIALFLLNLDKFGIAFDIGARVASYFKGAGTVIAGALETASIATKTIEQAKEGDISGAVQRVASARKDVTRVVVKKPTPSVIARDLKEGGKEMWDTRKNAPHYHSPNGERTATQSPLPSKEPKQNKIPESSEHILDLSPLKKPLPTTKNS